MKQLFALLSTCIVITPAAAQSECGTGRYTEPLYFTSVDVTEGVLFGSNTPVSGGGTQQLYMDIYEPAGDTMTQRPAVVVGFGGSFIGGSRGDVADFCTDLAKRGYVAVAPDYRVGFFWPNVNTTQLAVVRCMHDMRAAIRFLRKTVDVDANPYGIDPDRIIVGGVSAGGIGAIHVTYLDQSSEIPTTLYDDTLTIGGIEGNSGWGTYSSDVLACFSLSGAIGDTSWITTGDQPLCSLHEVGDGVVPYGTQEVSVVGIPTGLEASGSSDIHLRLDNIGVPNCFLSYPGNGHVGYMNYDEANATAYVADFMADLVCGFEPDCGELNVGLDVVAEEGPFAVQPNPAVDDIRFSLTEKAMVQVVDASGRVLIHWQAPQGMVDLDVRSLPAGLYTVRCAGANVRTARFVKN